jgi:hypothetical protein
MLDSLLENYIHPIIAGVPELVWKDAVLPVGKYAVSI